MDDDLDRMTPAELSAEVKKLRGGLRAHRDGDRDALGTLFANGPDTAEAEDSAWGTFCGGCLPAPPSTTHEADFAAPPRPILSVHWRRRA